MTSDERREARYQRRKASRQIKRRKNIEIYDNFDRITSMDVLIKSAHKCASGIRWKPSVQRFLANDLFYCSGLRKDLIEGNDVRKGFVTFDIMERGHKRHIQAVHISERIPQKALTQMILRPVVSSRLIYDNGACMPGKGVLFATNRLEKHLHDHYRKYGDNEGWVVLYDFEGYFASIPHKGIKNMYRKDLTDPRILTLSDRFVDAYEGDTGLGLGSELSQPLAVSYPNPIDHEVKDLHGVHGYARYMDDGYAIVRTKEEAIRIKDVITSGAQKLQLKISEKKTHIVKLSHGFRFLKTKFILTNTGKVVKKIWNKAVTRQRRKLKKLKHLYEQGLLSMQEVKNSFFSWLGYASHKTCHRTIREMQKLFVSLFPEETEVLQWKPKKKHQQNKGKMCMSTA